MKKAISAILSLVILATPLFTICFSAEADQQLYKGELGEETYFTMDFESENSKNAVFISVSA